MKEQYFTVCVIKDGKKIEQCEFYGTKEQCEKALSLIGDGDFHNANEIGLIAIEEL